MTACDICGKPAITQAMVEGARLSVCAGCLRYGTEVQTAQRPRQGGQPRPPKEYDVVEGFGRLVRKSREKAGMSRQELARKLFVFDNVLERVEDERLRPDEKLARKLEKELGITILEEKGREAQTPPAPANAPAQASSRGLTLADIIEIKKK